MSGTRLHRSANQGTVSQFAWPVVKERLTAKGSLSHLRAEHQLSRGAHAESEEAVKGTRFAERDFEDVSWGLELTSLTELGSERIL